MPARSPPRTVLFGVLAIAVLAIGLAAPLVRLASAPALAIAFWRMTFSTALTGGFWALTPRAEGVRYGLPEWGLASLSGVFLGIHFAAWIASLEYTSVTASVVLVNTQPVFVAAFARVFLRERLRGLQWLGVLVAVAGAALISLEGVLDSVENASPGGAPTSSGEAGRSVVGHSLALLGAVTGAAYYVIGRSLRRTTPLWAYVTRVYGVSALVILAAALVSGTVLAPHPARSWVVFVALALGPSLLGHTLLNWSLRWLPAAVVNVCALGEPIVAGFFAALLPAIDELPGTWTLVGGGLTLLGVALVVRGAQPDRRPLSPAPPRRPSGPTP